MMESLPTELEKYNFQVLKQIAGHVGVETAQVNKAELVRVLAKTLVQQARSEKVIQALSEAERAVLALLLQKGKEASLDDLLLPLIRAGLVLPEAEAGTSSRVPTLQTVLRSLAEQGLIVNLSAVQGNARRSLDYLDLVGIPPEIQIVLPRALLKLPQPHPDRPSLPPPERVESVSAEDGLRRLFFVWAELRRQPGKLLMAGGIGKRDLRRLAASVGLTLDNDEETVHNLYDLLAVADLLVVQGEYVTTADDKVGLRFWSATPPEQLRQLVGAAAALESQRAIDLGPLSALGFYYGYLSARPVPVLRKQLLELLTQAVDDTWFSFTLFLSLLSKGRPGNFIFEPSSLNYATQSYRSYVAYGSPRKNSLDETLQQVEAKAVLGLLEPLKELGVVELGYRAAATPTMLRLTPLGHAALHNLPFTPETAGGQVVLQPDFQVLALGPVSLTVLASLERIAQREKFQAGVVEYRLTRDSIYAALQAGDPVGSILAFLRQVTGQPIPQNVERTVEEWGAQHERIVLRRDVLVLQVDQAALLEDLLQDPQLSRYLHPLDERTAWVRTQEAHEVEEALWEAQLLPAFSHGPEADLPNSLVWEDGRLYSRSLLPSLYVVGTVRRIATEEAGAWKLTLPAVRAAVKTGLTVPEIVALVEKMIGEPLPAEWAKQLKAWGGHFGQGQMARATLLRLENEEALRELRRADSRLRRWLHPLPGAEAALAVVEEPHWDDVCAILEEWGVPIVEQNWW